MKLTLNLRIKTLNFIQIDLKEMDDKVFWLMGSEQLFSGAVFNESRELDFSHRAPPHMKTGTPTKRVDSESPSVDIGASRPGSAWLARLWPGCNYRQDYSPTDTAVSRGQASSAQALRKSQASLTCMSLQKCWLVVTRRFDIRDTM